MLPSYKEELVEEGNADHDMLLQDEHDEDDKYYRSVSPYHTHTDRLLVFVLLVVICVETWCLVPALYNTMTNNQPTTIGDGDVHPSSIGTTLTCFDRTRSLPVLSNRNMMGALLQSEGFTAGAEIGVQHGSYSEKLLRDWHKMDRFYLVDIWSSQDKTTYNDLANVDDDEQERIYQQAMKTLYPYRNRTIVLRMYSSRAVDLISDSSLDFIYLDAAHTYASVKQDLQLYWPKLRGNGILAGHDYLTNAEVKQRTGDQDWGVGYNGVRHEGAVKAAVNEFASQHKLDISVTEETWPTYIIRKPETICE